MIAAPGHTPGHIALVDERDGTLIAGDAYSTLGGVSSTGKVNWRFPLVGDGDVGSRHRQPHRGEAAGAGAGRAGGRARPGGGRSGSRRWSVRCARRACPCRRRRSVRRGLSRDGVVDAAVRVADRGGPDGAHARPRSRPSSASARRRSTTTSRACLGSGASSPCAGSASSPTASATPPSAVRETMRWRRSRSPTGTSRASGRGSTGSCRRRRTRTTPNGWPPLPRWSRCS